MKLGFATTFSVSKCATLASCVLRYKSKLVVTFRTILPKYCQSLTKSAVDIGVLKLPRFHILALD